MVRQKCSGIRRSYLGPLKSNLAPDNLYQITATLRRGFFFAASTESDILPLTLSQYTQRPLCEGSFCDWFRGLAAPRNPRHPLRKILTVVRIFS